MYKHRYGLSELQVQNILDKQDYGCAICDQELVGGNWVIDHDHRIDPNGPLKKYCIRGILCTECNTGLGKLGDSIESIQDAMDYLKKYESRLRRNSKNNEILAKAI